MNITPQINQLPLATVVNPQTDSLRQDNQRREVITQPSPVNPSLAEQRVAGDKERARTPGQSEDQIDFAALEKNAAQAKESISERSGQQNPNSESEDNPRGQQQADDANEEPTQEQLEEQKIIEQMKARDTEVRIHEQAHATVGGSHTGSPSYSYETGPDGKRYIVDGEVSVDMSKVPDNPQATIVKMRQIHSAALAPAEPSAQDRKVAQQANKIILQAQSELRSEQTGVAEAKPSSIDSTRVTLDRTDGEATEELTSTDVPRPERDFDQLINQTLASQESIAPTQDSLFSQRANVIESRYSSVGNAYDQPPRSQFELIA